VQEYAWEFEDALFAHRLEGTSMQKLNTHAIYQLALMIHPLTELEGSGTGNPQRVLWMMVRARIQLNKHIKDDSVFSPSLKRAAGALLRQCHDCGLPEDGPPSLPEGYVLYAYQLNSLAQRAREFETVLANELPGLSIYSVSQHGIYATDDLITHADYHVPVKLREAVPERAKKDIAEAGRCLAFELSTAAAFHMWRALETVMNRYHQALTGKSFEDAKITRNWAEYIKALETAGADKKITVFLDHIRDEYRNPISHPSETLEADDAFNLFGTALSAIGQAAKAIIGAAPIAEEGPALTGVVEIGSEPAVAIMPRKAKPHAGTVPKLPSVGTDA
jgi:hypothetical protein